MTAEDRKILNRINDYADKVLKDFDPQKTRVSFHLEKIKPIMEEIATELNIPVEEVFMKYMDLASEASVEANTKFQNTVGNIAQYGDIGDTY